MLRDRLRTTDNRDGRKTAHWRLDGSDHTARIVRLEIHGETGPADNLDLTPPPDLSTARELHPEHTDLWDAVRDERAAVVLDAREVPAWGEHTA